VMLNFYTDQHFTLTRMVFKSNNNRKKNKYALCVGNRKM